MEQATTPLGLMLNLTGPVSIGFPELGRIGTVATITLSLDLPVDELPARGVRLPNLGHSIFDISSELSLDCESLIDGVVARSGNEATRSNINCTSADSEESSKSNDGGDTDVGWRAGLSVIIVAAITLLGFLGYWAYKKDKI
ncbi:hypothetical protein BJX63DRAFT_432982 [Aspergillus granulosus]|uniref:Uncharacterized protein n=1 Tax=Aspergillus granulosus TaxID=176169 RepID=A0ABR4HB13_9EURO